MSPSSALDPPEFDELVDELKQLRRAGITKLRELDLPALRRATIAAGLCEPVGDVPAAAMERLLVDALPRLGGGELEAAASRLLGLEPGTRGRRPPDLRDMAATIYEVTRDTFRLNYEPMIIEQMGEAMLGLAHDFQLRLSRLNLERRAPVHTRLAVHWLERFEANYRVWTPITGLYGDLEAYYSTLDEPAPAWWSEQSDGKQWDPQDQAEGYDRSALHHLARFCSELRNFVRDHGGQWLASDVESEQLIANAVYLIGWWTPHNERDQSWLRLLDARTDQELHPFLEELAADFVGLEVHREWQDWIAACSCKDLKRPDDDCGPHQVILQGRLYCRMIDNEWDRIADWYRINARPRGEVDGGELYERHHRRGPLRSSSEEHDASAID